MPRGGIVTHGSASPRTPEYAAWRGMKARCMNRSDASFARYGGRGITVCAQWQKSFAAFLAHVGPRPSPRHSIDRINNNLGYAPGNVRWATAKEQANNRTRWTHCKRGHAFTQKNTAIKKDGRRECRTCMRAGLMRRYYAKKQTPRARLSAAAPDLLAALLAIVNSNVDGEDATLTAEGYNLACAAIAKARGER